MLEISQESRDLKAWLTEELRKLSPHTPMRNPSSAAGAGADIGYSGTQPLSPVPQRYLENHGATEQRHDRDGAVSPHQGDSW